LESGSGEALIFDSLKVINKEKEYTKVAGNVEAIYQTASIFSLFIGGILGQRSFILAFSSAMIVSVIAIISAVTFYEPPIEKVVNSDHSFKNFLIHTVESFKTLFSKKKIAILTLFTTTLSAFSTVVFYYIQNYWRSTGLTISTIGLYLAIGSAAGALLSINVQRIERLLKRGKFSYIKQYPFLFFSLIVFFGIFLLAFSGFNTVHSILSVVALTLIMAGESGMFVSFQNFLHQNIPSHQRATIISIESMLFSIIMIAIFPIFGWIADISSFKVSFVSLSVIAGIFLFSMLIIMHGFSERREK
jgi:hypothetical protein